MTARPPSVSAVLDKLGRSWPSRAQVRRDGFADPVFDPARPDFRGDLLPFADHPAFRAYAPALVGRVLTCGWLIYNHKTIAIELELITPACIDLMRGLVSEPEWSARAAIAQTLTDEAYHTLLSVNTCRLAASQRELVLPPLRLHLLDALARRAATLSARDAAIARLGYATVSELFVSDYLSLLSKDRAIQPLHREAVAAHERDERAHRKLFPLLLAGLADRLSEAERRGFIDAAAEAILAFADCEYDAWQIALHAIGAPDVERILADCRTATTTRLLEMDYSALHSALDQLGLGDDAYARDRFAPLASPPRRGSMA